MILREMLDKITIPFLGSEAQVKDFAFMNNYLNYARYIDNHFIKHYGGLLLDNEFEYIDNDNQYLFELYSCLYTHQNELNRLYTLNNLEYDPIANYDKHSTITNLLDKEINTHVVGTKETTLENGEQKSTTQYGERNTTDSIGNRTDSNTQERSGFNSTSYVADNKNTIAQGSQSNTSKQSQATDTNTLQAFQNKATEKGYTNTVTKEGSAANGKFENVTTEETKGNIGTTTTQTMMGSEWDFRTNHIFYDYLFKIVSEYFCIPLYE